MDEATYRTIWRRVCDDWSVSEERRTTIAENIDDWFVSRRGAIRRFEPDWIDELFEKLAAEHGAFPPNSIEVHSAMNAIVRTHAGEKPSPVDDDARPEFDLPPVLVTADDDLRDYAAHVWRVKVNGGWHLLDPLAPFCRSCDAASDEFEPEPEAAPDDTLCRHLAAWLRWLDDDPPKHYIARRLVADNDGRSGDFRHWHTPVVLNPKLRSMYRDAIGAAT